MLLKILFGQKYIKIIFFIIFNINISNRSKNIKKLILNKKTFLIF